MAIKAKTILADELGVTPETLEAAKEPNWDATSAIEIDMDFDQGGEYPKGTYHARLEAVEKKVAQSGNTMLVWRFRTLHDKRAWWLNTVLTKDAYWKVEETARGCGAKGEGQVKIDVSTLVGNCCRLVIDNEVYEGANQPKVKKVLPPNQDTLNLNDMG